MKWTKGTIHHRWMGFGLVVGLLALASMSGAQTGVWTRKADMPTARYGLSTSVADGKIYAIGGVTDSDESSYVSTVEMYDPATDRWTPI